MDHASSVPPALTPLLPWLERPDVLRLVLHPHQVHCDPPNSDPLPPWSAQDQAQLEAAVGTGAWIAPQWWAQPVGSAIVLTAMPEGSLAPWVEGGGVSELAAEFLGHMLALGRNVVVTGPLLPAAHVMTALVLGHRVAWVGAGSTVPARPEWLHLEHPEQGPLVGAERLVTWGAEASHCALVLSRGSSVLAWADGGRVDRVLALLEWEWDRGLRPPGVVGVDGVVVLSPEGHVQAVFEVGAADVSARPQPIFRRGLDPVPEALVPCGVPTFLSDLAERGATTLVERFLALAPASPPPPPPTVAEFEAPPVSSPPLEEALTPAPAATRWEPPVPTGPEEPPGWELDRLHQLAEDIPASGVDSAEEAILAATYGLAPPPRPTSAPDSGRFEETLKRVRTRDRTSRLPQDPDTDG